MIDYSEGYLNLKRFVFELYEAMQHNNSTLAREICDQIVVEARLTKAQIGAQGKDE